MANKFARHEYHWAGPDKTVASASTQTVKYYIKPYLSCYQIKSIGSKYIFFAITPLREKILRPLLLVLSTCKFRLRGTRKVETNVRRLQNLFLCLVVLVWVGLIPVLRSGSRMRAASPSHVVCRKKESVRLWFSYL